MMRDVPNPARVLGLAGLIPFAGLTALAFLAPEDWRPTIMKALAYYGGTILAFMGGCRWGFASAGLGRGADWVPLLWSVAPSLWAWVALMLPPPFEKEMLALGFLLLYLLDLRLTMDGGAPAWWPQLRLPLTLGAAVSLLVAVAA